MAGCRGAELSGGPAPKERMPGSLAAALAGVDRGAQIVRVHDVAETVQALEVWRAISTVQEVTRPDVRSGIRRAAASG